MPLCAACKGRDYEFFVKMGRKAVIETGGAEQLKPARQARIPPELHIVPSLAHCFTSLAFAQDFEYPIGIYSYKLA